MISTEVAIIGAGPTGLFQVFELGLLGIHAHVFDSMPVAGGQCAELYPDKPIYDIPAVPVCSGRELTQRLQQQIHPFNPEFHFGDTVAMLARQPDGRFALRTAGGIGVECNAVIIAAGLGAFLPRKLSLPEAAALEGGSLHYKLPDASLLNGASVVVAGGGDAALDWALALVDRAASVVLVHHSEEFRALPARVARMRKLCDAGRMQFLEGEIAGLGMENGKLKTIRLRDHSGIVRRLAADHLVVSWGLHPALGPIADWGLQIERSQIVVNPATFQTSVPGVFAIGDICSYPEKKKLILSGFHEGALCAFAVHAHVNPEKKVHLQYTTTSPILQQRLGVAMAAKEPDAPEGALSSAESILNKSLDAQGEAISAT